MLSKEDFGSLINSIKSKLNEESAALIADDFLTVLSNYNNSVDEIAKKDKDISDLRTEKESLLKVNGQLYQRIGFEKEDDKANSENGNEEVKEETSINDFINEKGEMI